uniref:PD-(D/E)XK nuclease-like domain-containing protein n=1 Tax=Fusarium oxysporum (strain Fo5176) TaxID=660025 RepID=A0A0C4DIL7_FUSOF
MSRGSKRSKRSSSPTKLFPMFGPEGHRLVRDSLSMTAPRRKLPESLAELYRDFYDVTGRYGIIPRGIKGALDQHLKLTMSLDRVHDHMFFDDETSEDLDKSESMSPVMVLDEEILRRASRIADRSDQCSQMLSDEAAWNCLVHCPLLDLFTFDMADQTILDFMPCRVDFAFYFTLNTIPPANQPPAIPCFNWTSDRMLQQYPLAFSIETKCYGGNAAKGEQQMGIWHAAQWEFLITRAGAEAVAKLDFLPGIVIQGHTWSLVITMRNQGITNVLCSVEFGNTSSVVEL